MTVEIYEALKAAEAPEDKAIQAAEAVASSQSATKSDILMLEKQIMLVQSEQKTHEMDAWHCTCCSRNTFDQSLDSLAPCP